MVAQLIQGAGWRITGEHRGVATHSVSLRSRDARGVEFVVTAKKPEQRQEEKKQPVEVCAPLCVLQTQYTHTPPAGAGEGQVAVAGEGRASRLGSGERVATGGNI